MAPAKQITPVIEDVLDMIEATRGYISRASNANPTALYWRVGKLIADAASGTNKNLGSTDATIARVAKAVEPEFGGEFSSDRLTRYVTLVKRFPDYEKVVTLCKDLQWEHFDQLIDIEDSIKRDFYAWMTVVKKWSPRKLKNQIEKETFEKTPSARRDSYSFGTPRNGDDYESALMSALVTRDPKLLAFLGIDDL